MHPVKAELAKELYYTRKHLWNLRGFFILFIAGWLIICLRATDENHVRSIIVACVFGLAAGWTLRVIRDVKQRIKEAEELLQQ
jgi:hypothetical protein